MRVRGGPLAVAVSLQLSPAVLHSQSSQYSPSELRTMGRAVVAAHVEKYGRVYNAAREARIKEILDKIQRVASMGGARIQIRHTVVDNDDVNAGAAPGGYLVINVGLIRFVDELARQAHPRDAPARLRLGRAHLAAVLAHEVAHITLGHSDSLAYRIDRLLASGGDTTVGDPDRLVELLRGNLDQIEQLQQSRERERTADRTGALYLLRAGWTMQTAMDFFKAVDGVERSSPDFYSLESVTYLRSHPRAADREASLEAYRAELKLLQVDLDDAITLIRANLALESAIELLGGVLAAFPTLSGAQHARGAAYHQLWLNTVSLQTQQLRASLLTYGARLLPVVRGVPGDMALYGKAKADYEAVLSREPLPATLSQLALLDAYAGSQQTALRRASAAAAADPESFSILNNRGVVQYLVGQHRAALQTFRQAAALPGGSDNLAVLFNVAKSLHMLGAGEALPALRRYVSIDTATEWRGEALRLLGGVPETTTPRSESSVGWTPPRIQGIALGDPIDKVVSTLGQPEDVDYEDDVRIWHYRSRGLSLASMQERGVVMIGLTSRAGGDIFGVRVGDPVSTAQRFGSPSDVADESLYYVVGPWLVVVTKAGSEIALVAVVAGQ